MSLGEFQHKSEAERPAENEREDSGAAKCCRMHTTFASHLQEATDAANEPGGDGDAIAELRLVAVAAHLHLQLGQIFLQSRERAGEKTESQVVVEATSRAKEHCLTCRSCFARSDSMAERERQKKPLLDPQSRSN